jgi:hypothetical protein
LNGLSDHHGQILILENLQNKTQNKACKYKVRQINEETIKNFQLGLENENWDEIYKQDNVNSKFNIYLNTFLIKYEYCFPVIYKNNEDNK